MDPIQELENSVLARQHLLRKTTALGDSTIQKFYEGSSVLVTGGLGFLGKLLIEKLLRACSIKKIFIVIRSKKNKTIQERLEEVLEEPIFESLHKEQPNFAAKIVLIEGDIIENKLGINDNDWNTIINEVDTIFHMAAIIRFDAELKDAVLSNVRGTKETLQLGLACKNLRAFVYVSTAYTYATKDRVGSIISEEFQEPPMNPDIMMKIAEAVSKEKLEAMMPALINGWPNTYTFTKAIAEEAVRELSDKLPVCVVRPAIVIAPHMEPMPGWVDTSNVYGPTGLVLGVGLGVVTIAYANLETNIGFIPADLVTNAIIAAAWETGSQPETAQKKAKVYTVGNFRNPLKWRDIGSIMRDNRFKLSSPRALWYCCATQTSSFLLFWLLSWLLHYIPAYIVDCVCFLCGKERRFVKLCKKMYKLSVVLSYFSLHNWHFSDTNLEKLFLKMSPADQTIFNFDITTVKWTENLMVWWMGIRKYIIKDGLKGTRKGNNKQKILFAVHHLAVVLYVYVIAKISLYAFHALKSFF